MNWPAILPSFIASVVEFVEALTIVLVIGVTINWKSSLFGALAAFLSLGLLILIFGSTILSINEDILRLIIGIILVLFGMQWLKKALLRYSGLKALHDEQAIFEKEKQEIQAKNIQDKNFNIFGFLTSYKSVLLEGLEVAFIVITFGVTSGKTDGLYQAGLGALFAFILVAIAGLVLQKPLTLIPENTLKFIVGIMLVTFGTFWSGEGLGIEWPKHDWFIFGLIFIYLVMSVLLMMWLKLFNGLRKQKRIKLTNIIIKTLYEVYDFFIGDWVVLIGFALTVGSILLLIHQSIANSSILIVYLTGIILSLFVSLVTIVKKD